MRSKIFVSISCVVALLVAGVIGCGSSGSETVAVVGDYEITTDEFGDFFQVQYPFPSAAEEFEKRREVLDTVIMTRMLIQAAYEKGIDQDEELARAILAHQDRLLLDVLGERVIMDKAAPTEAEIKKAWNQLEYKTRASHILLDNPDTANMILERLQDGENFGKLAYEYSIDPSAQKNKGDLGYFVWGAMVKPFQDAVASMEPGQISPPVKTRFGYHIIKVVDRLPNENRTDYESMKHSIADQIRQNKAREIRTEYLEEIKERFAIKIDTSTCDYLIHKRETIYPPILLESLPRNDFDIEQLDRNERELILASWDGGQMSVVEYLNLIKDLSPNLKPSLDAYDSLVSIIFNLKLSDILVMEAHRMGLDNDPLYVRKLRLFKELTMAEIMKNDSLPNAPEISEDDLRQYYEEHREEFTTPAKVRVFEILLSDELKARKLVKEINSREEFKEYAMDLTERPGKRAKQGDLGYIERKWFPEIFDLAVKTPIGEIAGPAVSSGKYSIFYVEDRIDAALKDFLGVKREIAQILEQKRKEKALEAWVEERKKTTNIEVDEDALWSTVEMGKYADRQEEAATNN